MPCPDDEWDPALLFDDPDDEFPLDPPPRPIHDVIRDLDDYQPS
ncbi:hypothetical protein ACFWOG_04445 [Kitasatospora sp. NPDC058406]